MIRVATWNVEKATPKSKKGRHIQQIIKQIDADIFVLTEGCRELMPEGFVIEGGTDWGYKPKPKCLRKVLLWSKYPLVNESLAEFTKMPPGRFASATVQHPDGDFWQHLDDQDDGALPGHRRVRRVFDRLGGW